MAKETGIIYLIRHQGSSTYKIGMTSNWDSRSRALRVGSETRLIKTISCEDYKKWERVLHKIFSADRLPGSEYFQLDPSEAVRKVEWIATKANNTHTMVVGKWKTGQNGLYRRRKSKNGNWYTEKPSTANKQMLIDMQIKLAENICSDPIQFEQQYAPERFNTIWEWNPAGLAWLALGIVTIPLGIGVIIALISLAYIKKSKIIRR